MEWTVERIKALREILANLYPKEDDARLVVSDIAMQAANIAFSNKSITTWYHILERAKHERGQLDKLYGYALSENPTNEELKLVASASPPAMVQGPEVAGWRGPERASGLERIIGQRSTLVPVSYLELGILRSKSVARIRVKDGGSGTGFLVNGNILITNHHVLASREAAHDAVAQFNYQETIGGLDAPMEEFRLAPDELFVTSPVSENDWTAVRVAGTPSTKWGALEMRPCSLKVGDHVNIIQHAGGGPKQVSFSANVVVFVNDTRIQYLTDTLPGSSGSPVFDTKWNLVGLHHSGGWLDEPNAPQKTTYYRNEGIPIEQITRGLTAALGH